MVWFMSDFTDGEQLNERINKGPVLCWVTNQHNEKCIIRLITLCVDNRFYANDEVFNFARPLSAEDIKHFSMD